MSKQNAGGLPVFFSTKIPLESSTSNDLGVFVGLDKAPKEWAELVLRKIKEVNREYHSEEIIEAGFDSTS